MNTQPSFFKLLGLSFSGKKPGNTELLKAEPPGFFFELEWTVNGEIIVHRRHPLNSDFGWAISRERFIEIALPRLDQALIETHSRRGDDDLFSFAIKCKGIQVFLRSDLLYVHFDDVNNPENDENVRKVLQTLDELYPPE